MVNLKASKIVYHLCPAAFTNAVLQDERWLLGAVSKDVAGSHLWTNVLRVTPSKQPLFINRILFLHSLAMRRGGKSSLKLSLQDWQTELTRMMLLSHVWENMCSASGSDGNQLFDKNLLDKLLKNIIEGLPGVDFFYYYF